MAEGWVDPSGAAIPAPMSLEEPYAVIGIEPRTTTIAELCLRPRGGALEYLPGEYVVLEDRDRRVPPRSFSIANAPRPDGLISLLITHVPDGETSTWLHERLRVGEEVSLSGPYGTFVDDPTSTGAALFLAAGSGLAPIRALLEAALAANARSSLTLIFSAHSEADVIDRDRFATWEEHHASFRFIRTLTRGAGPPPRGRAPALLPRLYADLSDHDVFIAGAPGFVLACAAASDALGARAYTRRCSSSSRSRGQATPRGRRQASECEAHRHGTADLHQDRRRRHDRPTVRRARLQGRRGHRDMRDAGRGGRRAGPRPRDPRGPQPQEIVLNLQRGLFAAAAEIAANPRSHDRLVPGISSVTAEMTAALAQAIDALVAEHPLRPAFVVPGANPASAVLDLGRTFLRRAERRLIAARERGMAVSAPLLAYVNRASDLAYVLARRATGGGEPLSHE